MTSIPDNDRNVIVRKAVGKPADLSVPPILFMVFNRASTTKEVFEKVRQARPAEIYVAGNGPRPDQPRDQVLCKEVWDIFDSVDWECEIHTNFRVLNIGMHRHWWSALDWFFEEVESGIILEDDCVPHISFFHYCTELLERYKDDDRIMHINGSNFQFGRKRGQASYYFSVYPHVWGWATWRRAWQAYDDGLASFPSFERGQCIDKIVFRRKERKYWMKFFRGFLTGEYKNCDIKWLYSIWSRGGLSITPNANLISNIGHGLNASNTFLKEKTMGQPTEDIGELRHPSGDMIAADREADTFTFNVYFYKNFFRKAFYKAIFKAVDIINRQRRE